MNIFKSILAFFKKKKQPVEDKARIKNPEFDLTQVLPHHLALLQEVHDGIGYMRNGLTALLNRKLVRPVGYYRVEITLRGRFALANIFDGSRVGITDSYHLAYRERKTDQGFATQPFMVGKQGTVVEILEHIIDADGFDQYGYVIKRASPSISVAVRLDEYQGQMWDFNSPHDPMVV